MIRSSIADAGDADAEDYHGVSSCLRQMFSSYLLLGFLDEKK
jgi:hypothetical protein